MTFFQLTLNNKHILDSIGRPYVFDSKSYAIDFAQHHGIRYDNVPEVCIMPVEHIRKLEGSHRVAGGNRNPPPPSRGSYSKCEPTPAPPPKKR
ncbi:MAG: hypothetical protein [Caudoviricetes sp.]|nr:MAG: hypothetical protein [Caudoviricetes sp.]